MKNKNVFTVAVISLIIFISIAAYLWYLYFRDYEKKLINDNCQTPFENAVELVNTGNVSYVDANPVDSDSLIPIYYFSVRNNSNEDFDYIVLLEDVTVDDGCTEETRLSRSDLEYELKMDNKTISIADLESLQGNVIDTGIVRAKSVNDYSLKIRIKNGVTDYQNKHFHYVINIKEKE